MGWLRDCWRVVSAALGPRLTVFGVLLASAVGAIDHLEDAYRWAVARLTGVPQPADDLGMIFGFPSWIVGALVAVVLLFGTTLQYAVKLRRRLDPKIAIEFVPGDPEFEETEPKSTMMLAKRTFRLRVRNLCAETVKDCSLRMVRMIDANGTQSQYGGVRFKRRHDNPPHVANMAHEQSFDIAADDYEDVDIVSMVETESDPRFTMCYASLGSGSIIQMKNAIPISCCPEILTVKATAANSTPVEAVFKIDVDDSGRLIFERQ